MRHLLAVLLLLLPGAGVGLAATPAPPPAATPAPPPVATPVSPPAATPAPAPPPRTAAPPRRSIPRSVAGEDGPADTLNGLVLLELKQCGPLPPPIRRACCERLLHPNACIE